MIGAAEGFRRTKGSPDGMENASTRNYVMLSKPLEQLPAEVERLELRGTRTMTRPERRKRARYQVHWPVCFFGVDVGRAVETITENLSSSGFHCFSQCSLSPGTS